MIRSMKLSDLAPKLISKSEFAPESQAGMINASISINYVDGHSAHFRVVGISDSRHSISYEVVSAEPNMSVSSVQNEIKLYPVSDTDHTFIRWITDFSNDVDL